MRRSYDFSHMGSRQSGKVGKRFLRQSPPVSFSPDDLPQHPQIGHFPDACNVPAHGLQSTGDSFDCYQMQKDKDSWVTCSAIR